MIQRILKILYRDVPASFPSDFPRMIPLVGNSVKPIFVGAFQQSHGHVVLEGRFTMFLFSKNLMTLWLAFALVWTIIAALVVLFAVQDLPGSFSSRSSALASSWPA